MKMLPVQLSLNPPLGLWSDVLWRCPPAPPSQLAELKTQLPPSLPSDPRLWSREDVSVFLRFCEREFDLPKVEYDLFQMNGKALCLLTRTDFGHRCPGAGDVLHNVLQMLIIESHMMQWHLPNSPVTPTSRYPLSPHSHPPTPTWPPIAPPESPFHNAHMHHFMAPNSVTLSPPPSVDSQASSPPQIQDQSTANTSTSGNANGVSCSNGNVNCNNGSLGNGGGGNGGSSSSSSSNSSNSSSSAVSVNISAGNSYGPGNINVAAPSTSSIHSDSDEDSYSEVAMKNNAAAAAAVAAAAVAQYNSSPPTTPILKNMPHSLSQQITNSFVNSWTQNQAQTTSEQKFAQGLSGGGGSVSAPTTPSFMHPVKREFFPESPEPNTNGRLLWDFLQQLLNDRNQKYSDLIAWKCRDTGVFKIVDPAGLAKLWGIQKNHLSMNYDKMSRALRYYYRVNILRKVQGERHCYQFLRNPTELKNIKNISLLRQSINGATQPSASNANGGSNANSGGGGASTTSINGTNGAATGATSSANQSSNSNPSTNMSSTNWSLPPHQSMMQQAVAIAAQHQQQQQQQQQQSPQRPSSHNNNNSGNNNNSSVNNSNNISNNHHMSLPAISSSAAAAVAAAAAAAYGPPPSSPLFMHAINGAFHYLSSNSVPPPNSPALTSNLSTSSDKFQFNTVKLENNCQDNCEEMKPTDLSVAGACSANSEKRPYSSPSAEDCYPLIRNADGLTTIKLIRYNDSETSKQLNEQQMSPGSPRNAGSPVRQDAACEEEHTPMNTDSDGNSGSEANSGHYDANMMATDLRK